MNEAEKAECNREIADGYLEAALWTNGVDEQPGEYQADEDKIAALAVFGAAGVCDFIERMGDDLDLMAVEARRIGHCVHYEREGHGTGFMDEPRESQDIYATPDALLEIAAETARALGPDYALTDEIMARFETDHSRA